MAVHLKSIDVHPDQELSQERADAIFSMSFLFPFPLSSVVNTLEENH